MPDDDDFLDGICDLDAEMGPPTADADLPWVVLFAGVDLADQVAVEGRRQEWRQLDAAGALRYRLGDREPWR